MSHLTRPALDRRPAVCAAGALFIVAVVHLLDGPPSFEESFAIGGLEVALAAACAPLAIALLVWPLREAFLAAALLCVLALGFYVASRTVGLFGMSDDLGRWWEPLGVVNVISELVVVGFAVTALRCARTSPRG